MRRIWAVFFLASALSSCGELLRLPDLETSSSHGNIEIPEFEVEAVSVSLPVIKSANRSQFVTRVVVGGEGSSPVKRISPAEAIDSIKIKTSARPRYRIGVGDVLNLNRVNTVIDTSGLAREQSVASRLVVGDSGYIELVDAGKVFVMKKTVEEAARAIKTAYEARSTDIAIAVETLEFPVVERQPYRIASADELSLQFILHVSSLDGGRSSSIVTTKSIVDDDGLVRFLQVGTIEVGGLTLSQAQERIGNAALQAEAATDQVQLSIVGFNSQSVVITGDIGVRSIPLSITTNSYDQILSQTGLGISEKTDYVVELSRSGKRYTMRASSILSEGGQKRYSALDGDRLTLRKLSSVPDFRVSIEQHNAHAVNFVNVEGGSKKVLKLGERGMDLRSVLLGEQVNVSLEEDALVKLQRRGQEIRFSAKELLLSSSEKKFWLLPGDSVIVEPLIYETARVLVVGQVGNPTPFTIDRLRRSSLADALFDGKLFQRAAADFKQIYLLRRQSEFTFSAYHFDLSDVENITLAEEMELRPDDVVFVRTNPIAKFNAVLDILIGLSDRGGRLRDEL